MRPGDIVERKVGEGPRYLLLAYSPQQGIVLGAELVNSFYRSVRLIDTRAYHVVIKNDPAYRREAKRLMTTEMLTRLGFLDWYCGTQLKE